MKKKTVWTQEKNSLHRAIGNILLLGFIKGFLLFLNITLTQYKNNSKKLLKTKKKCVFFLCCTIT